MFGCATSNTFAPHFKTAGFHLAAHQFDDLRFVKIKLQFDGFKRRSVFLGHFNNARLLFRGEAHSACL
jgi:hypothetical protein